jgi:tripartite-type tricarboxylate transporter receptor subunit TctC
MNLIHRIVFSVALSLGLVNVSMAAPDTDWPKKPIQMILSFPAGGSTDVFARSIAVPLGEALGQAVVIENKPGAGGMIGMTAAAKANPDGYTIHFSALTNQAIAQALFNNPPFSLQKDFSSVAQSQVPTLPAVFSSSEWHLSMLSQTWCLPRFSRAARDLQNPSVRPPCHHHQ